MIKMATCAMTAPSLRDGQTSGFRHAGRDRELVDEDRGDRIDGKAINNRAEQIRLGQPTVRPTSGSASWAVAKGSSQLTQTLTYLVINIRIATCSYDHWPIRPAPCVER
jgi:hypothetical protein